VPSRNSGSTGSSASSVGQQPQHRQQQQRGGGGGGSFTCWQKRWRMPLSMTSEAVVWVSQMRKRCTVADSGCTGSRCVLNAGVDQRQALVVAGSTVCLGGGRRQAPGPGLRESLKASRVSPPGH
jgi:hypothetical protein